MLRGGEGRVLLGISSDLEVRGSYWQQIALREPALEPKKELGGLWGPVSEQVVGEDLLVLRRWCLKLGARLLDAKLYMRFR